MDSKYLIYSYRVIYAYTVADGRNDGLIKVADRLVTLTAEEFKEVMTNPSVLKMIAEEYLPAGATLQKAWFGTFKHPATGKIHSIKLQDVYNVLEEAHEYVAMREEDRDKWFKASVDDIDTAINRAKKIECGEDRLKKQRGIIFRPEQKKAIDKTVHAFRDEMRTRFLWNAKMRFGKTLCALQVAKDMGYKFTLIITHRPVVDEGWHKDFDKIFTNKEHDRYGSRNEKDKDLKGFNELVKKVADDPEGRLVFFASMQYLRGSHLVGAKKTTSYKENAEKTAILNFPWDFIVVDEAHEGTQSERGVEVMRYMKLNVPEGDETSDAASSALDAIATKNNDNGASASAQGKKSEPKPVSPRNGKPVTLALSGTPFNLYSDYSPKEIYSWDYVREQQAKANWHKKNGDDPNPYDVLPRVNIFNLDIEDTIGHRILEPGESEENSTKKLTDEQLDDEYAGFSFSNFFRVWDKTLISKYDKPEDFIGKFVHEAEIMDFFYSLARETQEGSNFPFSTDEFKRGFRHTFWLIPGVKEGKALQELIELDRWTVKGTDTANPYKKAFRVINAAGSEQEDLTGEALKDVEDHILLTKGIVPLPAGCSTPDKLNKTQKKKYDELNAKLSDWKGKHTITLSCGKLTTGVSVPDWTAVLYMKGNDSTSASTYMQTIFRVQTPAVINGAQKTECYVFDFSPIRSLRVFADAVRLNMSAEKGNDKSTKYSRDEQKEAAGKWIKYLPLQAITVPKLGSSQTGMEAYDADSLFRQLDSKLIDRVVRSGYADNSIYDSVKIMDLTEEAEMALANISLKITADAKSNQEGGDVKWGKDGPKKPTNRQKDNAKNAAEKKDYELTEEEKEAKRVVDAWNRQRRERMKTLRALSVRIPLLMYGADIKNHKELEITNFTTMVDDQSWLEYMPKNITKEDFDAVRDCYDSIRFKGAAEKIREFAEKSDLIVTDITVTDRVKAIANIFSLFHNPDKETVLTPWRVVNMHMADTIGGYRFFADDYKTPLDEPVKVTHEGVTDTLFVTPDAGSFSDLEKVHILEINSKTGLYPLYVAYSLFRARKAHYEAAHALDPSKKVKEDHDIWEETLKENLFVVCKTPMAVSITRRTLAGFSGNQVNAICPKWEVSEKILADAGVIKLDRNQKPNPDKMIETDLVGILRAKEEVVKENERRAKRKEAPLDLIFTDQVKQRSWWESESNLNRKLDHNKFNEMIKFNAVVGNPPYQQMDGGTDRGAIPVYNHFVEASIKTGSTLISMIMPARWYAGGRGLEDFRSIMMEDKHLRVLNDFEMSKVLFPTVNIAGGLCTFLRDNHYTGPCKVTNYDALQNKTSFRYLNQFNILIRSNSAISILSKVVNDGNEYLSELVLSINPFGFRTYFRGYNEGDISILTSKGWAKVRREEITKGLEYVEGYKIIVGRFVPNNGEMDVKPGDGYRVITEPQILGPKEINTETYIDTAVFFTKQEAINYKKFLHTKFARYLLRQGVTSVNVTKDCFSFIPKQDFSENSDIDWSQSVSDIDRQLYKKYDLGQPEIDFIEKMIKPME